MHIVVFAPAARFELIEAQDWYENEAVGLGRQFRLEVDAVIERIHNNALQFPAVYKHVRRALLRRYPYALLYVIHADESVIVVACFHGSRNPIRWQERI